MAEGPTLTSHQLANIVDVEADARVGIFSARSIAASIRIIREGGYRCDSLSFIAGYDTQERVSPVFQGACSLATGIAIATYFKTMVLAGL